MRLIITVLLATVLTSCLTTKQRMNRIIGSSEKDAMFAMGGTPNLVEEVDGTKLLVYYSRFTRSYMHVYMDRWRYTTLWVNNGIVTGWTVKEEPIPPNQINIRMLIGRVQ